MFTRFLVTIIATFLLIPTYGFGQTDVTCHIRMFDAEAGSPLSPLANAIGINRWGNIVGAAAKGKGYVRYTGGRVLALPVNITGFPNVFPKKRNAFGVTVGVVENSTGTQIRGFILSEKTAKVFTVPGHGVVYPAGINRYGTVVGNLVSLSQAVGNGFVYKDGKLTRLPIPVAHRVTANSDTGVILGDYVNSTNPQPFDFVHGFVFAEGTFRDLSVPWAVDTWPTDINATGMIVGVTGGPGGNFIYKNGKFYRPTLLLPDGRFANASIFGVNGFGTITGNASDGQKFLPFVGTCSLCHYQVAPQICSFVLQHSSNRGDLNRTIFTHRSLTHGWRSVRKRHFFFIFHPCSGVRVGATIRACFSVDPSPRSLNGRSNEHNIA